MLVDFSVTNYGPFRDKVTLSAMKTEYREHPENVIEGSSRKVLSSLIIFGPNASGKSYLLKGMAALRRLLRQPNARIDAIEEYDPFRFSESTVGSPTEFEICLDIGGSTYIYTIAFDRHRIRYEALKKLRRDEHPIFERRDDSFVMNGGFPDAEGSRARKPAKDAAGENIIDVSDKTTPNTPYLTVAAYFNDELCNRIYSEIRGMIVIRDLRFLGPFMNGLDDLWEDEEGRTLFFNALRAADFDITDIREDEPVDDRDDDSPVFKSRRLPNTILVEHNHQDIPPELRWLPLEKESEGTKNMIRILGPIIRALKNGGTIVVDEFGSSLHPVLARHILELFGSEANIGGAQLIVNSHDLDLMDIESLFRRDQIYFVNKGRDTGASELYSLSDFKGVRKDMDVKKAYLLGRFDAIPNIISDRRWKE